MSSSIGGFSATPDWTTAKRIAEERGGVAVSPTTIQYKPVTEKTKKLSKRMPSTSQKPITRALSRQTKLELQKLINDEISPPTSTTTSRSSSPLPLNRRLSPLAKAALSSLINRESPEQNRIPLSQCSPSTKEAVRRDLQDFLNGVDPTTTLTEEVLDDTLTELAEHLEEA